MFFYTKPQGFATINKDKLGDNLNESSVLNPHVLNFMKDSQEALRKINEDKSTKASPMQAMYEGLQRADMGKELYEEYDQLAFEGKARVDMLYYEQMLRKLPDEYSTGVHKIIVETLKTIRQIYEFVNIRPEIYGTGIDSTILEKPINESSNILSKKIFEHIDKNFYNLTPEQRKVKYIEECRSTIKDLINEGAETEAAIESSIKSVIIESLLTKIAFPFTTWTRIKHLSESEDYGIVFDQADLLALRETFESKINSLSKIIASTI